MAVILDEGLWWSGLKKDVGSFVRHCIVCRAEKDSLLITGLPRSKQYGGPFPFLIIDAVGPMSLLSPGGYVYMFTCACA